MKNLKAITFVVAFVMIASTAVALTWLKKNQKLGRPGIKASANPDSPVMNIELPAQVLDYTSTNLPTDQVVLGYLPKDTSYAQRGYRAPDGFQMVGNIILMGADRSSIHKPDYCLSGQGFQLLSKSVVNIPIDGPSPYQLPVSKWIGGKVVEAGGQKFEKRLIYVFWFVADHEQTPDYDQRYWWLMRDVLKTAVLQRWAYVSYQTECLPGAEDACFERMKNLIAASVPEFQLPPTSAGSPAVARK